MKAKVGLNRTESEFIQSWVARDHDFDPAEQIVFSGSGVYWSAQRITSDAFIELDAFLSHHDEIVADGFEVLLVVLFLHELPEFDEFISGRHLDVGVVRHLVLLDLQGRNFD